jgi:hypothetical protein
MQPVSVSFKRFGVLVAELLNVQVFRNIAPSRMVNYVSKDRSAFIFRVMQT